MNPHEYTVIRLMLLGIISLLVVVGITAYSWHAWQQHKHMTDEGR